MSKRHGFSLLEFAIVVLIVSAVVYALIPRISDSLMLTHETVVRQTAAAFRDGLQLIALKAGLQDNATPRYNIAGIGDGQLDLNASGAPIGTDWQPGQDRALQAPDCVALWYAVLGALPPSASVFDTSDFRVQTVFARTTGLGCRYRYLPGGNMHIHYFPDTGTVTVDDQF